MVPWTWARFLSLARSKLRLCSANHRAGYFSNLACDWLSIVWAYSGQETENGPWSALLLVIACSWQHQAIIWASVDLSSIRPLDPYISIELNFKSSKLFNQKNVQHLCWGVNVLIKPRWVDTALRLFSDCEMICLNQSSLFHLKFKKTDSNVKYNEK